MKKIILLLLSFVSFSAFAAGSSQLVGHYNCTGHDPFSKVDYQATLTVTQTDETYQFNWDLGQYGKFIGTGFLPKGIDNFIPITVVSLMEKADPENPNKSELQVYKIEADGSLKGSWTFLGKSKISPAETCVKVKV